MQVLEILLTIVYQASLVIASKKHTSLPQNYFDLSVKKVFFYFLKEKNMFKSH